METLFVVLNPPFLGDVAWWADSGDDVFLIKVLTPTWRLCLKKSIDVNPTSPDVDSLSYESFPPVPLSSFNLSLLK